MNVKLIASQLLTLTLLIVAYAFSGQETAKHLDEDATRRKVLGSLPVDRILAIEFSGKLEGDGKRESVTVRLTREKKGDENWSVDSSWTYPVKADVVQDFIKEMRKIQVGQLQSDDLRLLDKFELDEKERTQIRFLGAKDKELGKLVYGKSLPGDEKHSGQTYIVYLDRIYRAPHVLTRDYLNPKHWLDLDVIKLKQDQLAELHIMMPKYDALLAHIAEKDLRQLEGKPPREDKQDAGKKGAKDKKEPEKRLWRKAQRDQMTGRLKIEKVNESLVESLVWTLANDMMATEVAAPINMPERQEQPNPSDMARYGMAPPVLRVRLYLRDKTQYRLWFGEVKSIDAKGKEQRKVYVMLPSQRWITKDKVDTGLFGKSKGTTKDVLVGKIPVYEIPARVLDALTHEEKEFDPPKDEKKPGQDGKKPGQDGNKPGQDGNKPGQDGNKPGQGGKKPGQGGKKPGQDGNKPGQGGKKPLKRPEDDTTIRCRLILVGYKGAQKSKATRSKAEALALAAGLHQKLTDKKKPASFADLARKHSEDESRVDGGDLGFLGRGVRSKAFNQVAFKLQPGQISGPVVLSGGVAVIQRVE